MKPTRLILGTTLILVGIAMVIRLFAAETRTNAAYEYATIRWAGVDNTHSIRPGGQVELIGGELRKMPKPDRTDNRSFYLNCAMNGLTKEGYEFAGISNDDIVMKRALAR